MSANVAESAGAGDLGLQAPDQREIFIGNPILGVASAKMINAMADFTAIDHLLGQRDCRHAPVIVTNHVRDPRAFYRVNHPSRFGHVSRQRFFAEYRFARPRGGNRNLRV